MERFVSQNMEVLIEQQILNPSAEDSHDETLWLGRLYCQAPDIDGAAVITGGQNLQAGKLAKCRIAARRGFDLVVQIHL
jgi:ribosomal protein S12 methylthiotransferase